MSGCSYIIVCTPRGLSPLYEPLTRKGQQIVLEHKLAEGNLFG